MWNWNVLQMSDFCCLYNLKMAFIKQNMFTSKIDVFSFLRMVYLKDLKSKMELFDIPFLFGADGSLLPDFQ